MIHVSVFDFLKTGQFGDVKLGMSREEVLEILGEPVEWYNHKGRELMLAHTWDYYWVSFDFTPSNIEHINEGLFQIRLSKFYNIDGIEIAAGFTLDTWALSSKQDVDFVAQRLTDAGLTYIRQVYLDKVIPCIELELESGVTLIFQKDYGEEVSDEFYFLAVGIARPTKVKHPTRQLTVTLPLALYDKVRHLSQKHSESISSICSELLISVLSRLPDNKDGH